MDDDLYALRVVKPRSRKYKRLPVVALDWNMDGSWISETGETGAMGEVVEQLPGMIPTIFALEGSADFLSLLDSHWSVQAPKAWQWRVSENERAIRSPQGERIAARVTAVVHFFGFKGGNYHKLIDPVTMYGHKLDRVYPGDEPHQHRLLQWAVKIRDFCDENGMEVRPTIGGLAGQFWTDRRFYPHPRRKVPRATNDRARENLPGNHYALLIHPSPKQEFTAWYIDQTSAHHYHARTTIMPNADSLYAYGDFRELKEPVWTTVPSGFYGLLCVKLELPEKRGLLHWIKPNHKHDFIFTNEIPHLLDLGYKVQTVFAGWGSYARDHGVARYATFAMRQLAQYDNAPWIKPLLLAAYGTLATRAGYGETVFKLAKKGEPVAVTTGRRTLHGTLVSRKIKLEPGIANVIHRGMIEAACRSESVGLAQWLDHLGYRVLSIYADAVIVRQDDDFLSLPALPEPWRIQTTLNHLQFINQQAFVSGEMTKLPGVSREQLRYRQHTPGYAPRKKLYDSLSGRQIQSDRRI